MAESVNASCKEIALVSPSDTGDLTLEDGSLPVAVVVTGLGDIKVDTANGSTIVLPSAMFTVGDRFPLCVSRIYSTSTTATGIYVLYGVG